MPQLEKLARDDGVVLRKINIVQWGTPVTRQYQIRAVPHVRVYGGDGEQIGRGTSSITEIEQSIKAATARL